MNGKVQKKAGISGIIGLGTADIPPYTGDHTVTPEMGREKTLETRNKRMTGNITVRAIPVYRIKNPQGGYTVIIGGDHNV